MTGTELERLTRRLGEINAITNHIPALIAYTDPDGRYQHANGKYQQWVGLTPDRLIGRTVGEVLRETVGEAYWEQVRPAFERALRGERVTAHAAGQHRDQFRHVEIHYTPDLGEDGRLRGIVCLVVDISARKQAEAELQHRAGLLDQAMEPVFTWAPGGGITYWNRAAEELYGYTRDEASGRISHELLRTRHPWGVEEFEARLMRDGAWTGELVHVAKSGREVIVDSIHRLVRSGDGPVVVETNRDITAKRRAERALRATQDRLRRAISASRVGVWEVDGSTGLLTVSENVEELFGLPRGSAHGWPDLLARVVEEDEALLDKAFREANEYQRTLECDFRVRPPDGAVRWLHITVRLSHGGNEQPGGMSGAALDITEEKNAQAALAWRVEERTRELQEVNRELESFSYSVSHDLRAPLRSVEGFGELLLKDYPAGQPLDETGRDYLRRMNRAAARMGVLIDDLLNLSRIGRTTIRPRRVDLSAIAADVLATLQAASPDRQVEVSIEPGMIAAADPGLSRAALENLLSNAWKFTGKTARAAIEFGRMKGTGAGRGSVYFVKDNGAGFDMRHAEQLFTAFHRLHRASEFEGNGIGLATVQRIVRRHGGRVWAEAARNEGATFYFTLGAADEEQADFAG